MAQPAAHPAVKAIRRIEGARIIAGVAHLVRDIGLAEDLAQDALQAELSHCPFMARQATRGHG